MSTPNADKIKNFFNRNPIQPCVNFAIVEARVKPADLAKAWSSGNGPFFFQRAPAVVVRSGDDRWLDPVRRRGGIGAIKLVAHVFDVQPYIAAWLLAEFAAIRDGVPIDEFMTPMDRDQDWAQWRKAS